MKVQVKENQIVLKEVYNSITLETREGKQLHICMRDMGFEMKIDDGDWHLITNESDFLKSMNKERTSSVTIYVEGNEEAPQDV